MPARTPRVLCDDPISLAQLWSTYSYKPVAMKRGPTDVFISFCTGKFVASG